jgi:hypothetical protein
MNMGSCGIIGAFFFLDWECYGIFMVTTLVPANGLRPTAGLLILLSHGFGVILDWLVYPLPPLTLARLRVCIYLYLWYQKRRMEYLRLDRMSLQWHGHS